MTYKVFVINPGSTSTKIAYFENENKLFETSVFHDAPELAKFPTINDQLDYRMELVLKFIKDNNIDLTGVDAIVGRGGASYPVRSGVYEITDELLEDTVSAKGRIQHPANLGPQLARKLQEIYGGRCFIVDSTMTDEYEDIARITGLKSIRRYSHLHALNLKATARVYCKEHGIRYEDGDFIVCHIDGGISVSAHRHGKMVDGNDASGGEGPFTPTRVGGLDTLELLDFIKEIDIPDFRKYCTTSGGFVSHFGTSNADKVHDLVAAGDPEASLVWDAMIYNICKGIGSMATVLEGRVDAIICGGGLLRFADLQEGLRKRCEWIAPIAFYPGEFEHEAMAAGAIRVLSGEEELQVYHRPE